MLNLSGNQLEKLGQVIQENEQLMKSFNQMPNVGMQTDGRTGLNAIHRDRSANHFNIAMKAKDLYFSKSLSDKDSEGIVYSYTLKNQNGDTYSDHAMFENGIGKESMPNYQRITIPLKVYGGKTSVSHMSRLVNQSGGFTLDLENEEKESLIMNLTRSQEHDASFGLDYYLDSDGDVDDQLALNTNLVNPTRRMNLRHATGLQSYIRIHNFSLRSISVEHGGYGNIKSVVADMKGKVLDQETLDAFLEPVHDSGGEVDEALCTFAQARAFRANFFPMQRGNIGEGFKISGPQVSAKEGSGFVVDTCAGPIKFLPLRFRKLQQKKINISNNQVGGSPAMPVINSITEVADQGTRFKVGDKIMIAVQAANVAGSSAPSNQVHTITTDGVGLKVDIAPHANAERFHLYASAPMAAPAIKDVWFVGQAVASEGVTSIVHKERFMPGLDSLLFTPSGGGTGGEDSLGAFFRASLGGKSMYELDLAFLGAHFERSILSYFNYICTFGRTYFLADNCGAEVLSAKSQFDLMSE